MKNPACNNVVDNENDKLLCGTVTKQITGITTDTGLVASSAALARCSSRRRKFEIETKTWSKTETERDGQTDGGSTRQENPSTPCWKCHTSVGHGMWFVCRSSSQQNKHHWQLCRNPCVAIVVCSNALHVSKCERHDRAVRERIDGDTVPAKLAIDTKKYSRRSTIRSRPRVQQL